MFYLLWLDGHTIVQTCYSCLYLQDLKAVRPMPLFGAFVDAFLIVCREAREAILGAAVFDFEDFLPSIFNLDLDASVYSGDPLAVWSRIEQECTALSRDDSPSAESVRWRLQFIGQYMLALKELQRIEGGKARCESATPRLLACIQLIEKL